jgi:hypothetical protein
MNFLPRIEGHVCCLTCGIGPRNELSIDREIAVGFGSAGYSKDGVTLWQESPRDKNFPTVADVEALALADPEHDWRIFFWAPLYEAEYQRQGPGLWVLVKKGPGFA